MMTDVLSMRSVSKAYRRGERRLKVLVDVSFDIAHGEVVAVVGSRYEGKTTLLKVASGIELADRGEVLFCGRDLLRMSRDARARLLGHEIAWTDGSGPAVHLQVVDYVLLPLMMGRGYSTREATAHTISVLERLSVAGCAHARWDELSNWERVLVSLARAVAGSPRLLVLDGLLDGLGVRRMRQATSLLASFASELGCGILMSATDLEASLIAERVFWFERGTLKPMACEPLGDAEVIGFPAGGRRGASSGASA